MTPKLRREITASLPDPTLSFLPGGLKIDKKILQLAEFILSPSASFGKGEMSNYFPKGWGEYYF